MTRSKYLGKTFGNWVCVHVGVNSVQGARAKWSGHRSYYYVFARITSDGKAEKMIRLNSNEAAKVYQHKVLVEDILNKREATKQYSFTRKVSYSFF